MLSLGVYGMRRNIWLMISEAIQVDIGVRRKKRGSRQCVNLFFLLVGAAGFEPATSCSQSRRATKLRYAPFSMSIPGEGLCMRYL